MKNIIQNIRKVFFDTKCPLCRENNYDKEYEICYNCYSFLEKNKSFRSFGKLYYLFDYSGDFRKLLLNYKSGSRAYYSKTIAKLIEEELFEVVFREEIDIVIPVPISKKRYNSRGFNQVEEVLKLLKYRYETINRVKNTKKMYKILDEKKRRLNIKNSFDLDIDVKNKNILIVDDIVTTGATFDEIEKTIKLNGNPNKVVRFAFAISKSAKSQKMRGVRDVT